MTVKSDWLNALASTVTAAIAVGTLLVVMTQLNFARNEFEAYQRARRIEKMDELYQLFNSQRLVASRGLASAAHPEGSKHLQDVFDFFEMTARAETAGLVTVDDVDYYFRDTALGYWHAWPQWLAKIRKAGPDKTGSEDQLYVGFEKLVGDLRASKGVPTPTDTEIATLLTHEQKRFQDELKQARMWTGGETDKRSRQRPRVAN